MKKIPHIYFFFTFSHFIKIATRLLPAGLSAIGLFSDACAQQTTLPSFEATALGDLGGVRSVMAEKGVSVNLVEVMDFMRIVEGGVARSSAMVGSATLTVGADLDKILGWHNAQLNISAMNIHGHGLSGPGLNAFQGISGTEADASTRLYEVWIQQGGTTGTYGKYDIRIGKQAIDQEFLVSQTATPFMNLTFGWAALPSADLPSGSSAMPLSAPGIRLHWLFPDGWNLMIGSFSSPVGRTDTDPQLDNNHGTSFAIHGGVMNIGELAYTASFGTTIKLGGWQATQSLADQRYDAGGNLLALQVGDQQRGIHRSNYGWYAILDTPLWKSATAPGSAISGFVRGMQAPRQRNLIDFAIDSGLLWKGPFENRSNDQVGFAVSYSHIGNPLLGFYPGNNLATLLSRKQETALEWTYIFQLKPYWQLQADIQRLIHPGANSPVTPEALQPTPAAWNVALRSTLSF